MDAPHRRLADTLRQAIADGTYRPGAPFPSHRRIAAEHGVGVGAAYQAVAVLRSEGLLDGRPGARLTVAYPPAVRTLSDPDAPWPHGRGDVETGTAPATADLQVRLGLDRPALLYWCREELLDPDSRPAMLSTSWRPGALPVVHVSHRVLVCPHELTREEAARLGLAPGMRALLVERTRYDGRRRPVEAADLVLPADRWRVGS